MNDTHAVILTALNLEYDAVRATLADIRVRPHPTGTRFEVGRLGDRGHLVALTLVGKGNHPAAVLAERAIAEFAPAALLFVGIAGGLKEHIALGDVVVATHVYGYHGGTSQDDGLKARPRVWEIAHGADQIARHLDRSGTWTGRLLPGSEVPKVHFGPIAAGEVVHYSTISSEARWIREHYSDALAIEMEGAGVAQAAHLNNSLPVIVVRGISDRADADKGAADGARWQERAAANAAAFATALIAQLPGGRSTPSSAAAGLMNTNLATGGARVAVQAGQIFGGVQIVAEPGPSADIATQLAEVRELLRQARHAGRLDEGIHAAAEAELDIADSALAQRTAEGKSKLVVALKRLYGLIGDVAELGARLAAVISAIRGVP
jgi:adenosylhomocysteine nucleosidase